LGVGQIFTFLGGIGLFLLGMKLMTEGLTSAAGDTLRVILSAATRSRIRAIASGILITAMVQSSSAVIFTTIGFVNASLLSLGQAVGVIYGSNLGTTLTSWVVALVGFNLDLQALGLPAVGIGMGLSVAYGARRFGALGRAIAGFGLFFLGIDVLKGAFAGLGESVDLQEWANDGLLGILLFVVIGIMLTLLMQSSSAALAVILTAVGSGLIPLTVAAAMVIGANVGTTSTGVFAAIGATAPAKRAASAHVIFNLVTAAISLLLLIPILALVGIIVHILGAQEELAISLAIFHTLVKLLGILVMLPLSVHLVRFLEQRFHSFEEDEGRPRFMDHNVQASPMLALDALAQELHRMNSLASHLAKEAVSTEDRHNPHLESGHRALESLNLAVGDFASGIPRDGMSAEQLNALPDAQRVAQYLVNVTEHALEMVMDHPVKELAVDSLAASHNLLRGHAVALLEQAQVDSPTWDPEVLATSRRDFETEYQALKAALLHAGTAGELLPRHMAATLERLSDLHRVVDQATKAAVYLDRLIKKSKVLLAVPEPVSTPESDEDLLEETVVPSQSGPESPGESQQQRKP
jgi:phosphate:Na+ symporter